ncbi:MAG: ferredoxin reductase [Actinomycetota bacterium]
MAPAALPGRLTWRVAEVVATVDETPTVRTLHLVVAGWPGHRPGQHLDVRLTAPDGYQAQRSYSIATPADEERLDLGVERLDDGEVSPYLNGELRVGDRIEVRGPIGGHFVWEAGHGGPVLLVGGGSGVVPLMAMTRARARAASTVPMRWLSSSRTLADVVYRVEVERLAAAGDGFEVYQTLTRDAPQAWAGHRGRIDERLLAEVAWPVESAGQTFVCGPTSFVEAVAGNLVALGHPPATIKTERFGATGAP